MSTALPTGTLDERLLPVKAIRAYFRQSLDQAVQRESIEVQRHECERVALALGVTGFQWARRVEYVDIDRAGDDFAGREQLQKLLRDAQPGDLVLAWKQDRIGRDMIDSAATIRELVKFRGCKLYTAENGVTPVTLDSAEQTAIVLLRGMVAQGEIENTRKRVRQHMRDRASRGYAAGPVPFGYRTVPVDPNDEKSLKRIEIDEAAAPVVRQIFELYLDGNGTVAIAKRLNECGALSPRGNGWTQATIWDLLRCARYKGAWAYGERRAVGRTGNRTNFEAAPEEEILRVDRPDLVIIAAQDWDRVQALRAEKARDIRTQMAPASHLLTKILRCGECEGPMHVKVCDARRSKWTKRYYVCTERRRSNRCTNRKYLPQAEVERAVLDHVKSTVLPAIAERVAASVQDELRRAREISESRRTEAENIRAQLAELRSERQRLVRLAAASDAVEVIEVLNANSQKAKTLEQALTIAQQPALDETRAAQLEGVVREQLDRLRAQLDGDAGRATMTALFPDGLRFKIGNGLWLIEGAASVPAYRTGSAYRLPPPPSTRATLRNHARRKRHAARNERAHAKRPARRSAPRNPSQR